MLIIAKDDRKRTSGHREMRRVLIRDTNEVATEGMPNHFHRTYLPKLGKLGNGLVDFLSCGPTIYCYHLK